MNRERIQLVRNHIALNRGELNMCSWRTCVAGITCKILDPDFYYAGYKGIGETAARLLGLSFNDEWLVAGGLFNENPSREESDRFGTAYANADVVLARLDALLS
jgi:hypothetical protein